MKINADEIASVIRAEIANYKKEMDVANVGSVLEVGDGIAQIFGLSEAMAGELLEFKSGAMGQVFNLESGSVGAVIYDGADEVKEGDQVRSTGRLLSVPVGNAVMGRVIDPLGRPLDGKGEIESTQSRNVEMIAPGIAERQPVTQPMHTGLRPVDSMVPIGRGQRELIIGDRKTGKTAIAIDTIINQKDSGVVCIYVAIGQKESTVAGVVEILAKHGAMEHTIVVSAGSSDPAPMQYMAPYAGCAIAEYFMYEQGKDTLVVYDDLTKQAAAYRQIALLLRRPPGREAYPGDVFYLHSRLLERACKLADRYVIVPAAAADDAADIVGVDEKIYVGPRGYLQAQEDVKLLGGGHKVHRIAQSGGTMTALPICETQEGEVSAYIPTNLISITDGQIYLEPSLFFAGVRPAINVGISVSRIGYKAADPAMKEVAKSLRLDLASFRELQAFAKIGMDLEPAAQRQLNRGERMVELLTQGQYQPQHEMDQVLEIFAGNEGFLDDLPVEEVRPFLNGFVGYIRESHEGIYSEMLATRKLEGTLAKRLRFVTGEYKESEYTADLRARRKAKLTGEIADSQVSD